VPFGAGSLTDIVARVVFDAVAAQLHQPVVIVNRPGAGATIGAGEVAKSIPDGHTFLVNSNAQVTAPAFYPYLPYDPTRDFSAVALLGFYPTVLVVSPSKGFKNVQEFVKAAKARRSAVSFASVGVGSATFMSSERFVLSAAFEAIHVPFRGAPEALTEVMEGRVDFCIFSVGTSLPFIRAGKLVPLAVGTPRRTAALPDVLTTLEAGFPNSDYTPWLGLFAPAHTPLDMIEAMNHEVLKAEQLPAVHERFEQLVIEPVTMSPGEFDSFIRREIALNAALIKSLGLGH
jgi:tripartite-type tricarboxylate transporter receptor subunit TctC